MSQVTDQDTVAPEGAVALPDLPDLSDLPLAPGREPIKERAARVTMEALQKTSMKIDLLRHRFHHKRALRLFRTRPDDIFITSFPKSGASLLQMMLYQLRTDGSMEIPHICSVAPYFEHAIWRDRHMDLERLPSPRAFKTHLLREELEGIDDVRWIYLLRNPGDAIESFYHHICLMGGFAVPREQFVGRALEEDPHFGSWFQHVRSWWPHRLDSNVLFLRFEEVVGNLPETVERVAAFAGFELDDERRERTIERCGIEFMRAHEPKFDPRLETSLPEQPRFIRTGRTRSDWRSVFPPELQPRLQEQLDRSAKKLGTSVEAIVGG